MRYSLFFWDDQSMWFSGSLIFKKKLLKWGADSNSHSKKFKLLLEVWPPKGVGAKSITLINLIRDINPCDFFFSFIHT